MPSSEPSEPSVGSEHGRRDACHERTAVPSSDALHLPRTVHGVEEFAERAGRKQRREQATLDLKFDDAGEAASDLACSVSTEVSELAIMLGEKVWMHRDAHHDAALAREPRHHLGLEKFSIVGYVLEHIEHQHDVEASIGAVSGECHASRRARRQVDVGVVGVPADYSTTRREVFQELTREQSIACTNVQDVNRSVAHQRADNLDEVGGTCEFPRVACMRMRGAFAEIDSRTLPAGTTGARTVRRGHW